MSTFFVSKTTIDAALGFVEFVTPNPISCKVATLMGRDMWLMNASAVCQRYGERLEDYAHEIAAYEYCPSDASPAEKFKQLKCFLYQCAEGDIPESQELYKALRELADIVAPEIERSADYAAAPWGYE